MHAQPRTPGLSAIIVVCVGATLVGAPGTPSDRRPDFRGGVELVALNVVVTDARKRLVDGLEERDFLVLEDGVRQPIAHFAGGRVPLDLVLLIDASASIGALRPFVERAADHLLGALRPGDRAAVAAFDTQISVLEDLTGDVATLRSAVGRAGGRGNTALFTSLYVALRQFAGPVRQAGEVRRLALVVVTDGEENASVVSLESLLDEGRCRGVSVYAVMVQSDALRLRERQEGRLRPGRDGMRQLATETGATAYFPRRPQELPAIASEIADELAHQYSLAYLPPRAAGGPSLRSVAVQLTGRPGLKVRTRTTYRADGDVTAMLASR